jgi:internalin A
VDPNLIEAERRIEEARRTRAESLDLGNLALRELPASLGELPHLKVLYLGLEGLTKSGDLLSNPHRDTSKLKDLASLAGLHKLQVLSLPSCKGVTDIQPLTGLRTLQRLDLSGTGVMDLQPLAGLQRLQNLNLSFSGGAALRPLSELRELQYLDLGMTNVIDLQPLAGLQQLQYLILGICRVTDLQPLAGLQRLQNLSLRHCTYIIDIQPLARLQRLQNLDLSFCGVTDLQPLAGLQWLQSLDLRYCMGITDLQPLAGLRELQNLDLANCKGVTSFQPLAALQGLQKLDLYDCRTAVPAEFLRTCANHPRLNTLFANEAVGVPREVLSHTDIDNCLPRLRAYLSELALGAEAENEVKVILLGNSRVGKTQLCRRFRGQPFDKSIPSTHGVQIWREELRIQTGGEEQVFQVNWWDFGGQDIYHGTHALFLRSRAVFLILWTPELENRDEYDENGITLRNQPLAYWLDYVRTLAGEGSPVIVVQSQCDRFADRRPSPAQPDSFEFFESCSYSAKEDLGRETLEGQLRDAIRYLIERNGVLEIGHGRAEVRRRLYEWRSEDQERKPEERQHRTLTADDFQALCDEVGGIASWEHSLDYFHHTGVVFYRPGLFSNHIILDQDWALEAVYTVFHRGRAVPWLRDSGRFTREDLAFLVWQDHSPDEQRLFLGLMKNCGVCFSCGKTPQGETRYVAPDLLPPFEAIAGRLHFWKEEPGTLTLRLEYRFFHPAIIRGLMSEIGIRAGDLAEYWKYGLWLKDGQRDTQVLVQFVDTSTSNAPGAGALELKAQGRDPLGLLRQIRNIIYWQRIGETPEELLTLDGITVARSALANVIEGRVLDIQRTPVLAAPFTAFFEDREHELGEAPAIEIHPQPLTADERDPEVLISYGWGDETPDGQIRAQVVDELYAALEKDGFRPVRDRNEMRPGDRISAFINRLTHADLVVAVISDKYLRSPYCMYEIYRLWQKSRADPDELLQRLVPIVLPEVRIGSFRERAPYLKHWATQAKELEELVRDPDLRPGRESWEEVRLVREFAHHVDDILVFLQDVLMPRQLEAHLDDGFQAVREALRRRIGGRSFQNPEGV